VSEQCKHERCRFGGMEHIVTVVGAQVILMAMVWTVVAVIWDIGPIAWPDHIDARLDAIEKAMEAGK
jgi:hypothetical protein